VKKSAVLFLFCLFSVTKICGQIEISSVSYEQLKPIIHKTDSKVHVVNFWATWCAPCIKELPYFEELNKLEGVEVVLVSLDFPKHKQKRLIPFVEKHKLQSKVVHLDDNDENYWINEISTTWSGALPATLIYTQNRRGFYEQSFTKEELFQEVKSYF
jgi:thiol-disulfide isomerase/thioredoxin